MRGLDAKLARLGTLTPAELRAEWLRLHGAAAPRVSNDLLTRGIAWRLQEKALGGLPPSIARALKRLTAGGDSGAALVAPDELRPGTRLLRQWQGRSISVEVVEGGFLFEGRCYRSLSQIAREVTGTSWSGPRFFGLTQPARARSVVDA